MNDRMPPSLKTECPGVCDFQTSPEYTRYEWEVPKLIQKGAPVNQASSLDVHVVPTFKE